MIPCTRCPSTATHWPVATFQRAQKRMRVILKKPVCAEHRVPIVESFLNRHEIAVYRAMFASEQGEAPDLTRSRMLFIPRGETEEDLETAFRLAKEKEALAAGGEGIEIVSSEGPEGLATL
jgi:hypothetical protein